MEKDDEVNGQGNSYTTDFRQYDPMLGRWFSMDPLALEDETPYSFVNDNPLSYIDPIGLKWRQPKFGDRPKKVAGKIFKRIGVAIRKAARVLDGIQSSTKRAYNDASGRGFVNQAIDFHNNLNTGQSILNQVHEDNFILFDVVEKGDDGKYSFSQVSFANDLGMKIVQGAFEILEESIMDPLAEEGVGDDGDGSVQQAGINVRVLRKIGKYSKAKKYTKGLKGTYQAHHLAEQRFLTRFGKSVKTAKSIILSAQEHNIVHGVIREYLPYGSRYTPKQIIKGYRKAYSDPRIAKPEWAEIALKNLGLIP